VILETKELQVLKDLLDLQDQLDHKGLLVVTVVMVLMETKELKVLLDHKVTKDRKV
tara:strand:+ start:79 stop:246 length:168 start_codon:yes stop_codon:yes gene_type:complete